MPAFHAVLQNRMLKDSKINAYWVMCNNNMQAAPNMNEETFPGYRNPDNSIVVSDPYPTVTAMATDLILPTAMWAKKEGAYGNAERRTQFWRQQVKAPGESHSDPWQVVEFSKRFKIEDVWPEEILSQKPEYRGKTLYRELPRGLRYVAACPTGALDPGLTNIDEVITIERQHNVRSGRHARLLPTVHADACTGCGKCEYACVLPEAAIKILPQRLARGAEGKPVSERERIPGAEAVAVKGWWPAHRWLILRRLSQVDILGLFLIGPLAGAWLVQGNINSSLILDVIPLTDPYVLLQSRVARHVPDRFGDYRHDCMGVDQSRVDFDTRFRRTHKPTSHFAEETQS